MRGDLRLAMALFSIGLLAACAGTREVRSKPAESGFLSDYTKLRPGGDDQAQLVYIEPGLSLVDYRAVQVVPVKLYAGGKDSDLAKLSHQDQQMLADRFQTALFNAMSKDWGMAQQAGPRVLVVRAALTDAAGSNVPLDIVATVLPPVGLLGMAVGLGADTALTVGRARAEVEVLDGGSGQQLMAAVDERVGTRGIEGVTDQWSDVQMAFDGWAERVRRRLSEVRGAQ